MTEYNIRPFLDADVSHNDFAGISEKIIGLKMLEISGYDISPYNLEYLKEALTELTAEDDKNGYKLPIFERIFGLYAFKLAGIEYSEDAIESYARHILTFQKEDGGFSAHSDTGDTDTTSAIVPLLVYLRDKDGFSEAISSSSGFLRRAKNKDDTYSYSGTANSSSTATALSALLALGFTNQDEDIGDISLALATFRLPDGSYSYDKYGRTDLLCCAQALIAYHDFATESSLWLSVLQNELQITPTE
ncbi:MAG: hypothetical protein E7588_01090 [Ruminococcaceae bacterium]|nr:hypothetical protein [Oscillospiraceae bacterium]